MHEFRRWATNAIRVLESQGTEYCILRDYEKPPEDVTNLAAWKAGQIKVNDSVIDNSIYKSKTRCYAVRGDKTWMQLGAVGRRRWYSRLVLVAQTLVVVLASWITNSLYFAGRLCGLKKSETEHSCWKLRPYEPVDVWINWAVAFAAQGLDDWIEQFDAVGSPKPADGRTSDGYEDRQSYFAREVLTSAVLLMPDRHFLHDERNVTFGKGHPLRWEGDEGKFRKKGKVDRMDMLQQAILSGKNLPFDAPHATKMPTGNSTIDTVSKDLKGSGYKSYDYDLKEAVGDMPSKFGNAIDKFTVDMLEWLTIMLNVGIWEAKPKKKKKRRGKVDDDGESSSNDMGRGEGTIQGNREADQSDSSSSTSSTLSSNAAASDSFSTVPNMENGSESELTEGSGPIGILRSQLGIADDGRPIVFEGGNGFAALPFQLKQIGLGGVFWGNRAVLAVSAAIDNWVALNAGDCIEEVLRYDPEWKQACLTMPYGQDGEDSCLLGRRADVMKQLSGERYLVYANDILERFRFAAQFGIGDITDLHLDQTISFVGVVMENVRSALAAGLSTGGRVANTELWNPAIDFSEGSGLLTRPFEFTLSEPLTCGLRSCEASNIPVGEETMMTRPVEMRVLWELQNKFQHSMQEETTPGDRTAMIGCILGFPALCFNSKVTNVPVAGASRLSGNATGVCFGERAWEASITPVCAPQELYVKLWIVCREERRAGISVRLARKSKERDEFFDWESWRDSFNGRLRGLRKWQERQGVGILDECVTYCGIAKGIERKKLPDPRTASQLRVWSGWLPHRPSICKYEVSMEGLIRQYTISSIGMEQEGMPVSYDSAAQEDLTYTLGAVSERLFELRRKELPTDVGGASIENLRTVIKPVDELVRQGMDLLKRRKPDMRGALQCFELAARNDNVDGLQHAVNILTDKKSGQASLAKALFLTKQFGWMYGSRHSPVQERASAIEDIYQKLLEYSNYESNVVLGLARFEVQRIERMEFNGSMSTCDVMNLLARSFRQTGQMEMVRQMVVLSAHCAWLRKSINPLGTGELLPVASWGSWLISTSSRRGELQELHFRSHTRNRTLLEIFLYAAGKTMNDWRWLEDTLVRDDILFWLRADALDEMSRRQDKYAPERNRCIIKLLRTVMNNGDREATALLGDIYERGISGVDADLAQAVEVYGKGAMQEDPSATKRLGTIAERSDEEARATRPRNLELLNDADRQGNATAASVLGEMYENGLGGIEVDLAHAVELFGRAATRRNGQSAERLGDIARLEDNQARAVRRRVLDILRKAVEVRNREAASVLGGIYESGLEGLSPDLVQAVELFGIGLKQWDSVSADRLGKIAAREDGQSRILRPHILKMLYDALTEDANHPAAEVLGELCERGLDIWSSFETEVLDLLSQRSTKFAGVNLLSKIVNREDATTLQVRPRILEALHRAEAAGNFEAASALGDIYEKDDVGRAVETFGAIVLQGHVASMSRLGKIALRTEGKIKTRAMQLLHEASDLEYGHAVAVQAAVLEHEAERENGNIGRAIELFARASLGGHEGSIIRLRNIVERRADSAGGRAMAVLVDVAWRESCSEASETEALAALGYLLESGVSLNASEVEAALNLFEDASSRTYCHQYSSYHQLKVAFSAARGLASIVRNLGLSDNVRQKAYSLLEEYVEQQKEGVMEFYAAILVNGPNSSPRNIPQAAQLYMQLVNMEGTSSAQQFVTHDEKAKLLGDTEILAMKSVVSHLEDSGTDSPRDKELARKLRRRHELLEEKMEKRRNHLDNIAQVLEYRPGFILERQ